MNQNWKSLALVGVVSSIVTLGGLKMMGSLDTGNHDVVFKETGAASINRFTSIGAPAGAPGDFVYAAEVSTPSVVHIKAASTRQQQQQRGPMDIFEFFGEDFGMGGRRGGPQKQESSGSGVIISSDGYIVTNNHVVEGAEELEVVLSNKRVLKAKVIGTDPSTDIAVIQVPAKDLPALTFGNSDAVKVGEWVVAVGNPFNLESTVTAGIISAKGRGLGIIGNQRNRNERSSNEDVPLESFLQTDAVVNPGNSGGALVNLKGELIGINTAIASPTGSFAGYAFAVPASLVKKVSSDLVKFGNVQRGYLGIELDELNNTKADEYGVKLNDGIYVRGFTQNSSARDAGIKTGDVITKIDGTTIKTATQLQELIGLKRPGEKTTLTVNRDGDVKDVAVTLRNRTGGKEIVKSEESAAAMTSLGAQFIDLNDREKQRLQRAGISSGVKVSAVESGKLARVGVEEGFIITSVNEKPVRSVKELKDALASQKSGRVQMEGLYLDAPEDVVSFGFNL
ncbi:MAG: Do family serine endopeptidase [Cytophagia bacterium]|nr:MAG: Do family serine endopeptidase [Runella sp.]TAG19698.1 MAG: Do family serine endopeptidase [Cytophagales bacterium]TAG38837.1 MAG: Do family serine endopeptidase [Cytophagia bacterium]TAG54558.1 MAG: Do family serine endopeptidase [Runella slithyformis]TAG70063.1 MAG: Do family serine endopeptidase [Runella slithyformis]